MASQFESLFHPKGVAVIGVSANPKKLGSVIFNNILKNGYSGEVFPVNPKYDSLFGQQCYKSVSSIPPNVDLAVIVIPPEATFDAVKDCARKGVKNLVIITAGFKEVSEEGAALEEKIAHYALKKGMRIVGPNCLGIISTEADLNASFAAQHPIKGNIGFISQSGAFNTAMLDLAEAKKLGFTYFVSLGNKSDINEVDLFEDWYKDEKISVIGAYIEQFSDGKKLVELASKNRNKPSIVLNSGISEAGKLAAQSHTGSLAGSARAVKTALKQAGIIQVDSIENMYSNLMMFSWCPLPKGNRVAIITNAGGPGIIVTDILSSSGLHLAQLSDSTKKRLEEFLPESASVNNPVDLLGDALADRYEKALEVISEDDGVDAILVVLTPQLVTQIEETAKVIVDFYSNKSFPVIPIFIGERYVQPGLERMWENRIPAYQFDEEAILALKNLTDYSLSIRNKKYVRAPHFRTNEISKKLDQLKKKDYDALPPDITQQIVKEAGLDTPIEHTADSYDDLLNYFKKGNFPVVIKATTEDAAHKTEDQLIYMNITNEKDLERNHRKLTASLQRLTGKKSPNVLIQEQIFAKEELILGVNNDQNFGHILLFGKGGIYTEVYNDTSTRLVYANYDEIEQMIEETNVSKILHGARGLDKLPTDKIITTLEKLQRIVLKYPQIHSIDINPAMITVNRCIAVDVKIFLKS